MKKYITFEIANRTIINRSNIVGFRNVNPSGVYCYLILDSGQEVFLNGITAEDALKILEKFDKKNE